MVKQFFLHAVSVLALIVPTAPLAVNDDSRSALIDNLINSVTHKSRTANVGVVVQSMRTGQILYQRNANSLLVPASSLKIFTAYAALQNLGPNFTYQTQLLTDGDIVQNGILNGNLFIKFTGDPNLEFRDLEELVDALQKQGVKTVKGDLIVDNSHFDQTGISPGTLPEDKNYCYAAPVNAMILNRNCIPFIVLPGKKTGDRARLSFFQNIPMPIKDSIVTRKGTKSNCNLSLTINDNTSHELTGCMRLHAKGTSLILPLMNTREYSEAAMRALLRKHKITLQETYVPTKGADELKVLATHNSEPLNMLVFKMMKHSDNLIANTLYKELGASYFKQPGTWDNGGQAIKNILSKEGIDLSNMVMVDGSGLSRYNLVSPYQITQLLNTAYHNQKVSEYFIQSLPVSGKNGTLKHRMGTREMIGRIHAKTGTMRGVTALTGYVETRDHEVLAFSIIANDFNCPTYIFKHLEDGICSLLNHG